MSGNRDRANVCLSSSRARFVFERCFARSIFVYLLLHALIVGYEYREINVVLLGNFEDARNSGNRRQFLFGIVELVHKDTTFEKGICLK